MSSGPWNRQPVPRYRGLVPASPKAQAAARGASRKRNTSCEVQLRRAIWKLGLRYRVDCSALPGRPDLAFIGARVAVFCDGDFWHGRNLEERLTRLREGHNAEYWVAKIQSNVDRDQRTNAALRAMGWVVLRFWESDIQRDPLQAVRSVARVVRARKP